MRRTAPGLLTRSLASAALVVFYGLSAIGLTSFVMGVPKAEARGRGFRGRGFRGFRGGRRGFRGRGLGIWWGGPVYGYNDSCYWSPRRGRWVCPYSYYPGYYSYYW